MSNNMDLGYDMFCYQCEQTAGGKGCTKLGVCGKTPEIANLQDLLIYQLKGISFYARHILDSGLNVDKSVVSFIENCLFTTLTNVNFNVDDHVHLLKQSQDIKNNLKNIVGTTDYITPSAAYELPETKADMLRDAPMAGIMYDKTLDPDIRSLRQTILYGLKGISAYGHQARELLYYSDNVDNFYIIALEAITDNTLTVEELIRLTLKTGDMAIEIMKNLMKRTQPYMVIHHHTRSTFTLRKVPSSLFPVMTLKILKCFLNRPKDLALIYIPTGKCSLPMVMKVLKNISILQVILAAHGRTSRNSLIIFPAVSL